MRDDEFVQLEFRIAQLLFGLEEIAAVRPQTGLVEGDHDVRYLRGRRRCRIEDSERKQTIYLAELKSSDNRRYLRVETLICPLEDFDAEKCLRINLILRVGYLAVGDLESVAYVKMCENLAYKSLNGKELEYVISHVAPMADRMEQVLEHNGDIA